MPAATALAYAYYRLGKFHRTYTICQEAIELAEAHQRQKGEPMPAAASAYAEQAIILGEWGEIDKAIQTAQKSLTLSELWGQADTIMLCLLALSNGLLLAHEDEAAYTVLQRARKIAQTVSPWFVLIVDQTEMRARLGAGDVDRATHLAQSLGTGLPASLQTSLMVRQNRLDEALALLETALPTALAASSLEAVRLGIIQALAFFLQNNQTRALSALKQTLELAEPENCIAAFLREGAVMERLLRLALAKSIYPVFVQKLLAAFETRRQHLPAPASLAEPLHEPLSERELEVLHLLAQGCSDKDIAQSLVIARETVHKHLKNIYGKLDVHSRTEAVACARRLGLL
jgi:LuxR family maltose regulon positive regulatory protein